MGRDPDDATSKYVRKKAYCSVCGVFRVPLLSLAGVCAFLCVGYLVVSAVKLIFAPTPSLQLHGDLAQFTPWRPATGSFFRQPTSSSDLQTHGFNQRLSDSLSLDRPTPDMRPRGCSSVEYPPLNELPATSVIFVFCDELLSTLLRSIHSVLNRSPPELLHEIILVNDGSKQLNLTALEQNIKQLPAKVTLLHHDKQRGLVQARLTGARAATGQTITVLDSHIEVQKGWLEPLMKRISDDHRNVVVPHIRSIDARSFKHLPGGIEVCGVLLQMVEHSINLQQIHAKQQSNPRVDPQPTPVMAGGLFSFDREFFFELGGYDEEMGFWGAENIEISFRIWMCGGRLELVPCSNVYHLFRAGGRPYSVPWSDVVKNKQRVIDVWMDGHEEDHQYAEVARRFANTHLSESERGPTHTMVELRDRLQCKSFQWFLDNVYPENYFTLFLNAHATGSLFHKPSKSCLLGFPPAYNSKASIKRSATAPGCATTGEFMLTKDGQLRDATNNDVCLAAKGSRIFSSICAWADHSDHWYWEPLQPSVTKTNHYTAQLKSRSTGLCLFADGAALSLANCASDDSQHWVFGDKQTVSGG